MLSYKPNSYFHSHFNDMSLVDWHNLFNVERQFMYTRGHQLFVRGIFLDQHFGDLKKKTKKTNKIKITFLSNIIISCSLWNLVVGRTGRVSGPGSPCRLLAYDRCFTQSSKEHRLNKLTSDKQFHTFHSFIFAYWIPQYLLFNKSTVRWSFISSSLCAVSRLTITSLSVSFLF